MVEFSTSEAKLPQKHQPKNKLKRLLEPKIKPT